MLALRWVSLSLMGVICVVIAGCGESGGPRLYPATGKVTYNGTPVTGANLTFVHSDGQVSAASTDGQGAFAMVTFGRPGAVPGQYQVAITKTGSIPGAPADPKPEDMMKMMNTQTRSIEQAKNELPEKYAQPQTSGLTAVVTEDKAKNVFAFDLSD
jgi:hypothetical protein